MDIRPSERIEISLLRHALKNANKQKSRRSSQQSSVYLVEVCTIEKTLASIIHVQDFDCRAVLL